MDKVWKMSVAIAFFAAFQLTAAVFDTVVLDPGHGGWDKGGLRNCKVQEKKMTLETALLVRDRLEVEGLKVVMTRSTDVYISLSERVEIANDQRKSIFVSIHFNADYGGAGRGIETYCSRYSSSGMDLRHAIHTQLIRRTGARNRGERRAGYYVLRHADNPAVLAECGFLSNPREANKIATEEYRQLLADGIAEGILDYRDMLNGSPFTRKGKGKELGAGHPTDSQSAKDKSKEKAPAEEKPAPGSSKPKVYPWMSKDRSTD